MARLEKVEAETKVRTQTKDYRMGTPGEREASARAAWKRIKAQAPETDGEKNLFEWVLARDPADEPWPWLLERIRSGKAEIHFVKGQSSLIGWSRSFLWEFIQHNEVRIPIVVVDAAVEPHRAARTRPDEDDVETHVLVEDEDDPEDDDSEDDEEV